MADVASIFLRLTNYYYYSCHTLIPFIHHSLFPQIIHMQIFPPIYLRPLLTHEHISYHSSYDSAMCFHHSTPLFYHVLILHPQLISANSNSSSLVLVIITNHDYHVHCDIAHFIDIVHTYLIDNFQIIIIKHCLNSNIVLFHSVRPLFASVSHAAHVISEPVAHQPFIINNG